MIRGISGGMRLIKPPWRDIEWYYRDPVFCTGIYRDYKNDSCIGCSGFLEYSLQVALDDTT